MTINTEITPVIVDIDEKEYPVAAKTVDTAEKLRKAEENAGKNKKAQYELWLEQLEILLGRAAVKELFPSGKGENLDRMEAIYYGVMDAFSYNGREAREARAEATVTEVKALSDALKPLTDLLTLTRANTAPTGVPTIKRA